MLEELKRSAERAGFAVSNPQVQVALLKAYSDAALTAVLLDVARVAERIADELRYRRPRDY